jgi:uncharacterized protein YcfJ
VLALGTQVTLADHGRDYGRDYKRDYDRDYDRDGYRDRDNQYNRGRGYDYARVIGVEPLVQRVRYSAPVEQCHTQYGYRDDRYVGSNRSGGAVLGGVAGAALGNHVGRGSDRVAATIAGAVLGAAIGNQVVNGSSSGYRESRDRDYERCRTRYEDRYEERISGYRVTYVYNGGRYVTELPYDPGRRLQVAVNVHPVHR